MTMLIRLQYRRHREPRSGVAIQCKVHWIASSASPPRNDDAYSPAVSPSSRAAKRRGDPVQNSLDCFVGYRLLAMTTDFLDQLDDKFL
jgi:hypothetical protein